MAIDLRQLNAIVDDLMELIGYDNDYIVVWAPKDTVLGLAVAHRLCASQLIVSHDAHVCDRECGLCQGMSTVVVAMQPCLIPEHPQGPFPQFCTRKMREPNWISVTTTDKEICTGWESEIMRFINKPGVSYWYIISTVLAWFDGAQQPAEFDSIKAAHLAMQRAGHERYVLHVPAHGFTRHGLEM